MGLFRVFLAERFLEHSENLNSVLAANRKEGTFDTQKFFLNRKRVSVEAGDNDKDLGVIRVFGGPLDLDVAYRALFVNVKMTADQVVALTLEKYNSRDSPMDYHLEMHITGSENGT